MPPLFPIISNIFQKNPNTSEKIKKFEKILDLGKNASDMDRFERR